MHGRDGRLHEGAVRGGGEKVLAFGSHRVQWYWSDACGQ